MVERLPHVEQVAAHRGAQLAPAADLREPEDGDRGRPAYEDERLQRLGIDHRPQAAEHGVDAGQHDHRGGAGPEVEAHQPLQHHAARVDGHRHLGEDVAHEHDHRQEPAAAAVVAALEKLGHREDAAPQVERHEHPAEEQDDPGVQLVVPQHHAGAGPRAGEADDVLGADVRGEQRRPDREPAHVPAREEVVGGGLLASAGDPRRDAEQGREVRPDDDPVQSGEPHQAVSLPR